jgi:hypothetical protein
VALIDWRCHVGAADHLMLDAKQAILNEQHRRFQMLQQEGRLAEAMQQFQVTMSCATDLLNESVQLLQRVIEKRGPDGPSAASPPPA